MMAGTGGAIIPPPLNRVGDRGFQSPQEISTHEPDPALAAAAATIRRDQPD